MTPSPEERAREIANFLADAMSAAPLKTEVTEMAEIMTVALRAAENEALERAAKVADGMITKGLTSWGYGANYAAKAIAAAIRALKTSA